MLIKRTLLLLTTMVTGVLLASGVALAAAVSEVEPNDSVAGAQAIAATSFDLTENADIADSTTAQHATVNGTGNDTLDYYKFTVPAGDPVRVILDMDHTAPNQYDPWIELYDSSGARLAFNDDARPSGDPGSIEDDPSEVDSRIVREGVNKMAAGTYYVAVGQYECLGVGCTEHMGPVPAGATYQLHVSIGDDTSPPDTTITAGPANGSTVNPGFATFSFSASEASTFECRLDQQVDFTSCSSPSTYTGLSLGSHTFEVRATNVAGLVDSTPASRTWTVSDPTPPQLNLPADITVKATGPAGAQVSWQAPTATDENPANPQVSCDADSGDTFPIGTTTVNCSATDAAGNIASDSFDVTVQETTAPEVKRVVPQEDATGIGPRANVSAVFSEAMEAGSINTNTVKLFKAGTPDALAAEVTYTFDPATGKSKVTLDPDANLQLGTKYKAVVTTRAKDLAGNRLDQDQEPSNGNQQKAWFFTVRN